MLAIVLVQGLLAQDATRVRTVATDLVIPWEIEFGLDGLLWTTERIGVMSTIDIETGAKKVILDKRDDVYTKQETGMLGFTWHPDFPDTPYVYIAYVGGTDGNTWRVVERYSFVDDTLTDPIEIFRLDPADVVHQGCRLKVLADRKLYVTMGDSPKGTDPSSDSTQIGKILRMNLDGTVPDDNPIPGNLLYTKGHRNVQGLVQLPNGRIWSAEHGNIIEDEVNLIVPNGSYGWPYVEGVCDEPWEEEYCEDSIFLAPKWSSGPESTVAPCGLDYYNHERYSMFKNSLLMCTLKNGTLFQLRLNEDGTDVIGESQHIQRSVGRLRDVAIHPDGRIFLCTSNQEPLGYFPFPSFHDDRIIELIPEAGCDIASFETADTTFARALVGDETLFAGTFVNNGDCQVTIIGNWNVETDGQLRRLQWRLPVVVLAGESYDIAMSYAPTSPGPHFARVAIETMDQGTVTMTLAGSTVTGLLESPADTVFAGGVLGEVQSTSVPFVNVGNDTLTVTGADVAGTDKDRFTAVVDEGTVLAPNDTIDVLIEYSLVAPGINTAQLEVYSTGYKTQRVQLIGYPIISSVEETNSTQRPIQIYPNPFSATTNIVVPAEHAVGKLSIYSLLGEEVWSYRLSGEQLVQWDGTTADREPLTSGTYVVMISSSSGVASALLQIHAP